jgi:hypothetical protein
MEEINTLKLKARILAMSTYLYSSTEKEGISEERKEFAYKLIDLLNDSQLTIEQLIKKESKYMSLYFDFKNKVLVLQKELDKLEAENKNLKDNLC